MACPCETRTSTCRSFATISSDLYRFLAITVLLGVKDIPQVGPLHWGRIIRDKLSASFLKAFQNDFEINGIGAIEKLREENPAKYAEIASRLIAMVEPPLEGFEGCRTPRDLGIALLKSVHVNEYEITEDMIAER